MPDDRCREPGCGRQTEAVFVEETAVDGQAQLFPALGIVWCASHGLSETRTRPGRSGPARLGRFIQAELSREFPPRGQRIWRRTDGTAPSDMMSEKQPHTFYARVAGVRWDRESGNIIPIRNLGADYFVRPESVDRENGSTVPPGV